MDFFTTSFVTTLETEMTSDEWRTSVLVAVFKNKNYVDIYNNYRGIKLMNNTINK